MSIKQEIIENVIGRLAEKYELFSLGSPNKPKNISEFLDVNSVYFSGELTCDGVSIKMGDIILFSEDVGGDYKCIHPDDEQPDDETYDCGVCASNDGGCQDFTEDDIFSICLARLRGLRAILLLGDGEEL